MWRRPGKISPFLPDCRDKGVEVQYRCAIPPTRHARARAWALPSLANGPTTAIAPLSLCGDQVPLCPLQPGGGLQLGAAARCCAVHLYSEGLVGSRSSGAPDFSAVRCCAGFSSFLAGVGPCDRTKRRRCRQLALQGRVTVPRRHNKGTSPPTHQVGHSPDMCTLTAVWAHRQGEFTLACCSLHNKTRSVRHLERMSGERWTCKAGHKCL